MTTTLTREIDIQTAREVDSRLSKIYTAAFKARMSAEKYRKWVAYYGPTSTNGARYADLMTSESMKADQLSAEAREIENADYKGWTRFFLVKHIHNSLHCSSFRWNTQIGWLPEVSGLTEEEAVSQYGATLCTKCFPSAPVEKR